MPHPLRHLAKGGVSLAKASDRTWLGAAREETQTGWLARLGKKIAPGRMSAMHQVWLENLSRQAVSGDPA